jgi:hypothetical protein
VESPFSVPRIAKYRLSFKTMVLIDCHWMSSAAVNGILVS